MISSGICPRCWCPNQVVPFSVDMLCGACQQVQADGAEDGVRALADRLQQAFPRLTRGQRMAVAARRLGAV